MRIVHNCGLREINEAMAFVKDAKAQVGFFCLSQGYLPVKPRLTKDSRTDAVGATLKNVGVVLRLRCQLRALFPVNHTKRDHCHFRFCFHSGDDSRYGICAVEEGIVIKTDDVFPIRLAHEVVPGSNKPTVLIKPKQSDIRVMGTNIIRGAILGSVIENEDLPVGIVLCIDAI
jgi:hypothetical protein